MAVQRGVWVWVGVWVRVSLRQQEGEVNVRHRRRVRDARRFMMLDAPPPARRQSGARAWKSMSDTDSAWKSHQNPLQQPPHMRNCFGVYGRCLDLHLQICTHVCTLWPRSVMCADLSHLVCFIVNCD
jgi:hypothetical protein